MADEAGRPPQLNDNQRRHILATCEYIDRLLADLDAAIAAASSASPFGRYKDDLTSEQKALLAGYATSVRAQMLRVLQGQGTPPAGGTVSLRHTVRASLGFVDIALEELRPQHMHGYGDLPSAIVPELNGLVSDLQALAHTLDAALAEGVVGTEGPVGSVPTPMAPSPAATDADVRHAAAAIADLRALCQRLRDSSTPIVSEALDLAAETASKALDWPDDAPQGIDEVVRSAVTKVGADHTEDIRLALASLQAKLRVSIPADLLRDMPQFMAPPLTVNLRLFLRRALGASAAHARVRRTLEAQVGPDVQRALASHFALLSAWADRVLAHISTVISSTSA